MGCAMVQYSDRRRDESIEDYFETDGGPIIGVWSVRGMPRWSLVTKITRSALHAIRYLF